MFDGRSEADLFGGPLLAANVRRGGGIVADLDDGDPWRALVGMARDSELEFLANGTRVGAAVDQSGRHRLSLVSRPGDLDTEGVEIWHRRALAHPNGDLDHLRVPEKRRGNPFGDGLKQVGGLALENCASGLLD